MSAFRERLERHACLVAAAPDLLAAAEKAWAVLFACVVPRGGPDDRQAMADAQQLLSAAIKKAQGEQK